jgi:hypothetical protein
LYLFRRNPALATFKKRQWFKNKPPFFPSGVGYFHKGVIKRPPFPVFFPEKDIQISRSIYFTFFPPQFLFQPLGFFQQREGV